MNKDFLLNDFPQIPKCAWGYNLYSLLNNKDQFDDFFIDKMPSANESFTRTLYEKSINSSEDNFNYVLNSNGHRSDNFHNKTEKDEILFAGCSFTFGEGLPVNESWSGQLFSHFKKNNICDKYLSIAYPGGSIQLIVYSIFKYVELFNKPKTIMALFPESERFLFFSKNNMYSMNPISKDMDKNIFWKTKENALMNAYILIYQLEMFCKSNHIQLIWSTWYNEQQDAFKDFNFSNYLYINDKIVINSINYDEVKNLKYIEKARDGAHPGAAFSNGIKNIFLKEYNEINKNC